MSNRKHTQSGSGRTDAPAEVRKKFEKDIKSLVESHKAIQKKISNHKYVPRETMGDTPAAEFSRRGDQPAKAAQDSKQAEDYYIDKRGCSRENARTYLRSETDEERTKRCGAYAEYNVGSEGKGCEHAKGHAGNHGGSSEGLQYIADSPSQEHGGFHSNTRETAKTALAELERVKAENDRLRTQRSALAAKVATTEIQRDQNEAAFNGEYERANKAEQQRDELLSALVVVLDQVDYTRRNCSLTDQVGAALPITVINQARAAIAKAEGRAS